METSSAQPEKKLKITNHIISNILKQDIHLSMAIWQLYLFNESKTTA